MTNKVVMGCERIKLDNVNANCSLFSFSQQEMTVVRLNVEDLQEHSRTGELMRTIKNNFDIFGVFLKNVD